MADSFKVSSITFTSEDGSPDWPNPVYVTPRAPTKSEPIMRLLLKQAGTPVERSAFQPDGEATLYIGIEDQGPQGGIFPLVRHLRKLLADELGLSNLKVAVHKFGESYE